MNQRIGMSPQLKAFMSATNDTVSDDTWGVHGLWTPGVRLMRSLQFGVKALVISVLFFLPIGLLSIKYVDSQMGQLAFSQAELVGVQYLKPVIPLVPQLLELRKQHTLTAAAGSESPGLRPARDAVAQSLAKVQEAEAKFGKELKTASALAAVKAAVDKTTSATVSDAASVFNLYAGPLDAVFGLIGSVLDTSNLTLDPDLDTYYLMDVGLVRLPVLIEAVGRARGISGALGAGAPRGAELTRLRETSKTLADFLAPGVTSGIQKVVSLHPELGSAIAIDAGMSGIRALESKAAEIDSDNPTKPTGAEVVALGDTAVNGLVKSQAAILVALEGLLNDRVNGIKGGMALVLSLTGLTVLLAAYFFFAFYRVTKGGLGLIGKHLQEVSTGDLRTPPHIPLGSDEPAVVILDLRVAYNALHELIRKVRHSARALHSAAGEIAAASLDLGGRTEAAAAALEEQASAMEEIGATVSATAERAVMAATFAVDNAHVAERGGTVFEEVVTTMREIHTSSSKINDIIGVIDGIAFQTNILALNAAVEAARAGEAGRGFAVVAAEVRTLAQRSAGAAREIKSLISASVEKVEGGTRIVEAAGMTMSEVVTNARQINQFLSEIATAAREQAVGVAEVGRSIQELDKNTQQNAALVEETNAAAAALTAQADILQDEIANFRVA